MTVYLCGAINARSDADCREWRTVAATYCARYGIAVRDPMDRDYRGKEAEEFAAIVEHDKADVDACDVLLVYFDRPSVGTSMEVLYAWERGKRILLVDASRAPLSPWLRYHASAIYPELVDALDALPASLPVHGPDKG